MPSSVRAYVTCDADGVRLLLRTRRTLLLNASRRGDTHSVRTVSTQTNDSAHISCIRRHHDSEVAFLAARVRDAEQRADDAHRRLSQIRTHLAHLVGRIFDAEADDQVLFV